MGKPNVNINVSGPVGANNKHRGSTEERPTDGLLIGFQYFDTDLGHPIWWDGEKWADSLGGTGIIGVYKKVDISEDIVCNENPAMNTQIGVVFVNTDNVDHYINISNSKYKTPDGEIISLRAPVGGYAEASFLNVDGIIYARGL